MIRQRNEYHIPRTYKMMLTAMAYILMAYALNIDPKQNLSRSLPEPVIEASQMSMDFYAGSAGVTSAVEPSTDLLHWSRESVVISNPDASQVRTATVNMTGSNRYLRLVVVH